jgi:hypothetical protein
MGVEVTERELAQLSPAHLPSRPPLHNPFTIYSLSIYYPIYYPIYYLFFLYLLSSCSIIQRKLSFYLKKLDWDSKYIKNR